MISLIFHAKVKWEEWIDMTDKKSKIYFIIQHLTHFPKEPFSWKTFMACISLGGRKSMQEQNRNFLLSLNSLFGWLKPFLYKLKWIEWKWVVPTSKAAKRRMCTKSWNNRLPLIMIDPPNQCWCVTTNLPPIKCEADNMIVWFRNDSFPSNRIVSFCNEAPISRKCLRKFKSSQSDIQLEGIDYRIHSNRFI